MKEPEPNPRSLTIPSAISPIFPNSFSPAMPSSSSLTSTPQTQPSDVFARTPRNGLSSFGKPSFFTMGTPTPLPDAPTSTGISKPHPHVQDISFKESTKEPRPSIGETPVLQFGGSIRNLAVPSPQEESIPNSIRKPMLQNKPVHASIAGTTKPASNIQGQTPAERSLQHQKSLSYPTPFTTQDVLLTPSKPYLPLEQPKVLQDFPSTGRTSLSSQGTPPISTSFASNEKVAATGNGTTATGSSVHPPDSLTTRTMNISQPSVTLADPQTEISPTVNNIQESSATDSRLLPENPPLSGLDTTLKNNSEVRQGSAVRTDPKRNFPTLTIHSDPRSIMLSTLSDGIMHNDGALLQQFIEYVIGPIIIDSIRETKDRRSWKQASQ